MPGAASNDLPLARRHRGITEKDAIAATKTPALAHAREWVEIRIMLLVNGDVDAGCRQQRPPLARSHRGITEKDAIAAAKTPALAHAREWVENMNNAVGWPRFIVFLDPGLQVDL
jgi:hypothetical protein